jgi:hypothetical protein
MVAVRRGSRAEGSRSILELWTEYRERAVVSRDTARGRIRDGWTPEAAFTTPKLGETREPLPLILAYITRNGPATVGEIVDAIPCGSRSLIGRTLRAAIRNGALHSEMKRHGNGSRKLYILGPAPRVEVATGGPAWINPIRARALGLPTVSRHDETPIDYANPMRGAA